MGKKADIIELVLPFMAEYVSVARLAVSGIANRIGFDIETIEDIKVAIAEVCNKIVGVGSKSAGCYKLIFAISDRNLDIIFDCEDKSLKCIFDANNNELGVSIINALMDDVDFCPENNYLLSISKILEGNI